MDFSFGNVRSFRIFLIWRGGNCKFPNKNLDFAIFFCRNKTWTKKYSSNGDLMEIFQQRTVNKSRNDTTPNPNRTVILRSTTSSLMRSCSSWRFETSVEKTHPPFEELQVVPPKFRNSKKKYRLSQGKGWFSFHHFSKNYYFGKKSFDISLSLGKVDPSNFQPGATGRFRLSKQSAWLTRLLLCERIFPKSGWNNSTGICLATAWTTAKKTWHATLHYTA